MAKYIDVTEEMTTTETKLAQYQNCWMEFRQLMEEELLPAIKAGKLPPQEVAAQARELNAIMQRHSGWLFPTEYSLDPAPRCDRLQNKVNAWLVEKVEEYSLDPALLNPEGQAHVSYNYKRYETRREWLEDYSDFKVPSLLWRALENIGVDLDNLKEYLSEYDPNDLGMELQVDDGETVDDHSEIERA